MNPSNLRYTKEHEWLKLEGEMCTVGVTDYAQEQMTDVVFAEFPEVGGKLGAGEQAMVLESVKSVSDIYAPVAGTVTEVNEALTETPELVNQSPYEDGWLFRMKMANPSDAKTLLDLDAYEAFLKEQP